jgi:ABC-type enterochelin transport system permease subunit
VNIVLKNFIISMATVIIGGLALWASPQEGGGVNIPWLLMVGFAAGCLVLSFTTWWKRRSLPKDIKNPAGKKGRGK